ncbi:hypothetical protein LH452_12490 [Laribacter hongkongensis]|uniref:EF-hand domain-containing protein n=1 Tax=Laribacter hongkongensis TaxID=168471 RepID=UPI001EFCA6C4|nr:EF-hand domain-containing protein [Laribacter hongkongensis]MCG9059738.1 hypothetical protein [Laribacter hongkongensis]MCG9081273.1 hypothetical protein [Laribacter hongkongensis]MCG9086912.1 hypothetical protein [Laribacter hongkongensis]
MTRQRTLLAALIASTLALTAGAAMARPGNYGPYCDTNGDGKISREEAQAMPRGHYRGQGVHYFGQGGHYFGQGNHFRGHRGGFNRLDTGNLPVFNGRQK